MNKIAKDGKWQSFCEKRQEILHQIARNSLNEFELCQLVSITKGAYRTKLKKILFMEVGVERLWELIDALGLDDSEKEDIIEVLSEHL